MVLFRGRWLAGQESPHWEDAWLSPQPQVFIYSGAVFLFGPMQFSPLTPLQVGHHLTVTGTQPYGSCHPIFPFLGAPGTE